MIFSALSRSESRGRTASIRKALSHLVAKSLPQRCQIRNLKEIYCQYAKLFPEFREITLGIIRFGMTHPISRLAEDSDDSHAYDILDEHDQLSFFKYLKFFVSTSINGMPPLRAHMMRICDWSRFVDGVRSEIRELNAACSRPKRVRISKSRPTRTNTMRPTITHARFYVSRWYSKHDIRDLRLEMKIPSGTLRPSTLIRFVRNKGNAASAYVSQFLLSGDRKTFQHALEAISPRGKSILASIIDTHRRRAKLLIHMNSGAPANIDCYICDTCGVVKNAKSTYTSLRAINYDIHTSTVCCGAKTCSAKHLVSFPINYDSLIYVKGAHVYFMCVDCLCFSRSTVREGPQEYTRCEECFAKETQKTIAKSSPQQ